MTDRYQAGRDVDLDQEVVLDKKGRRITEERGRQIADEAIATVTRGRPSLTAPGHRSPEVKARVPEELRARLKSAAARRGTSTSELVREALEKYLAS
jgi:Ribbon-helix-helix protein, copG family